MISSFFLWLLALFCCSKNSRASTPPADNIPPPVICTTTSPSSVAATTISLLALKRREKAAVTARNDENPLWPGGISDADVELLVKEIIRDPTLNIAGIPDKLEAQIYRSTVKIVLNAVYQSLAKFDKKPLPAGHELKLFRMKGKDISKKRIQTQYRDFIRGDVDEDVLEDVADRLLSNAAINQRLLPDFIERKLYINCLKLMFRLIGMVAASFRITIAGHVIRINISKQSQQAIEEAAVQSASLSLQSVDKERMKEYAREAGLDDTVPGWRIFVRKKAEFMQKLHISLFALILGILDDVFSNTRIELLSDRVYFDIVPSDHRELVVSSSITGHAAPVHHHSMTNNKRKKSPILPFLAGLGVGFAFLKHLE